MGVEVPITLGAIPVLIDFVLRQLFLGIEDGVAVITFQIIVVVVHVFVAVVVVIVEVLAIAVDNCLMVVACIPTMVLEGVPTRRKLLTTLIAEIHVCGIAQGGWMQGGVG